MIFLIDYDQRIGKLVSLQVFSEDQRELAEETRLNLELDLQAAGFMREIVTLEAPTEAHIRKTHRRYFETLEELVKLAS
ncbi:MAG: hypothetical protein HYV17_14625 [Xanthomonadales bacterium]|nr:hypothetical protein [Xanthomonadales bacterium]